MQTHGWTPQVQGCGLFQPKVTAESVKEAADGTSLRGPSTASRALSPSSQDGRAQRWERLSPQRPGPTGSHGGTCLAGPQLPRTPLSFQGSLSHWWKLSPARFPGASHGRPHWPLPAEPQRSAWERYESVPRPRCLRTGQSSGRRWCRGSWGQRTAPRGLWLEEGQPTA